ncbi:MAG: hypothetical protein ACXVCZ_21920, partial [Bdellovibrionota bacterium]
THAAAARSDGTNDGSRNSAFEVNEIGASHAASVGALFCAQAANDQAQGSDTAAGEYASCKQYFDAANAMNVAGKPLQPSPSVVDTESAKQTLSGFEKNFSVSGADFLGRMISSGGNRSVLSEMLSPKFGEKQMSEMFAAADSTAPAPAEGVNFGGPATKKSSAALRESLKKALSSHSDDENRRPAEVSSADPRPRIRGLEPLHEGIFAHANDAMQELTIFGVVHLKYQELQKKRDL